MEETYEEERKFVNLEYHLRLGRKRKVLVDAFLEKDKRRMSPYKMVINILPQLTGEEANGQEILGLGKWHFWLRLC